MEIPKIKWMMAGGTPTFWKPPYMSQIFPILSYPHIISPYHIPYPIYPMIFHDFPILIGFFYCRSPLPFAEAYLNRGEESPFISDLYLGGGALANELRTGTCHPLKGGEKGGLMSKSQKASHLMYRISCITYHVNHIYIYTTTTIRLSIYICIYIYI